MQEKFPLISICMPAYNAGRYIAEAIESLLNQTYSNWELIIVNDGSVDDTLEKVEKYNSDNRIKVFSQENKGQCAAANKAYSHSKGAYIKFFDADDILSPKFLESQIQNIVGSDSKIASAKWGRFYGEDLNTFNFNQEPVWKTLPPIEWLNISLGSLYPMMQCALFLIPRSILNKSGLWNEKLSLINDFDFIIRVMLSSEEIVFSEDAILYYRSGIENSLSGQKSRKALESAFLSITLGLNSLQKNEDSRRVKKIMADTYKIWSYEFYPTAIDLYNSSIHNVNQNGGSDVRFPCGGFTKLLVYFLGWKLTKRIKLILGK